MTDENPFRDRDRDHLDNPADRIDPARFPPLPLLSGNVIEDTDHTMRPIAHVEVVITCVDGTTSTIRLEERFGGWWPPADVTR